METNQLLINYYKKEEIKKVKQRQMEGLSNNEIINLANKTYITEEEIKSLLGIENEEKNINDESDFIIEYTPPSEKKTSGKETKRKGFEYAKAVFVTLVAFIGAAFTIMTFNLDVSVGDLFDNIYKWFMGVDKQGKPTILEFSYCVGLPIGIVVFFNHFSRKKLTTDPTPIHVEMRNYESQVNKALIEDASREGKTIDVS